jgi:hypothetical protein
MLAEVITMARAKKESKLDRVHCNCDMACTCTYNMICCHGRGQIVSKIKKRTERKRKS